MLVISEYLCIQTTWVYLNVMLVISEYLSIQITWVYLNVKRKLCLKTVPLLWFVDKTLLMKIKKKATEIIDTLMKAPR